MLSPSALHTINWIKTGIGCGFAATIVFPLMIFVDLPVPLTVFLAVSFGFLLALASIGLKKILELDRLSVAAEIGALANTIGGSIVGAMILVQVAVNQHMAPLVQAPTGATSAETFRAIWLALDQVQLALDVTWDFFIGLGTVLLAWVSIRHPRFGLWIGVPGIVLGIGLLVLNFWTFPVPPANAELIDLGPFVGLWYLLISIRAVLSLSWIRQRLE